MPGKCRLAERVKTRSSSDRPVANDADPDRLEAQSKFRVSNVSGAKSRDKTEDNGSGAPAIRRRLRDEVQSPLVGSGPQPCMRSGRRSSVRFAALFVRNLSISCRFPVNRTLGTLTPRNSGGRV